MGYNRRMILKPQDVVMLLAVSLRSDVPWTTRSLGSDLSLSPAEVSEGINRLKAARLLQPDNRQPIRRALEEFLIHGVKYAYPPDRGGLTRGVPTGYAAPPLAGMIVQPGSDPPVWPDPEGPVRGYAFSPLYKTVPKAAGRDACLYELLALVDAIRDGRPREAGLAVQELTKRIRTR